METDEKWMRLALEEAALAREAGEVPVGAVIVRGEELLARAHNSPIALQRPVGPCGAPRHPPGGGRRRELPPHGDDALCDARTLPHVRGGDHPGPDRTGRLRRRRSERTAPWSASTGSSTTGG